ncbi:MAG: DUF4173 domain-containing protein [Crocinitomicaceae bacterium]|nr:DUF4173 domain-containing protein [Crocinitomicaceae bacterium]
MKKNVNLLFAALFAVVFTLLFYNNALGINLLLFEVLALGWLYNSTRFSLKTFNVGFSFSGVLITSLMTVIHYSALSYTVNFFVFILFIGVVTAPEIRSLLRSLQLSVSNFSSSFSLFKNEIVGTSIRSKSTKFKLLRKRIFIIPLIIILLFAGIYGWANPKLGAIFQSIVDAVSDFFVSVFSDFNFALLFVFLFGVLIALFVVYRSKKRRILEKDEASSDELKRVRSTPMRNTLMLALINEYKSALFLFASLNVLLLGLNVMDINYVWINFEWEGQYLKEFVHEGTYVLIFAILLSIVLVLYFFRRNLNFYPKNKWLKRMTVIWIFQNLILTVSVAIRNWHYIQYYSLAYKRIAIVFFLILTIYGLYTVYTKVRFTKSNYYLIRRNFLALIAVLVISTTVNWDRVIAQYNFSRAKDSFVHLDFLADLSNSALPLLDQKESDLEGIQQYQEASFFKAIDLGSSSSRYHKLYMSTKEYIREIEFRKRSFRQSWKKKNWLEWNYAEWRAYNDLR